MQKWVWLLLVGLLAVVGLIFWWTRQALAPSPAAYRANVLQVLKGQGGLDPGLAFMLRGLQVDLDCRDEKLCTGGENFSYVYEMAEQYEFLMGDYQGRICTMKPSAANRTDHERLCHLLQGLLKEVGGVKMNASLALNFLSRSNPEDVQTLLRNFLNRILEHRERVLAITEELQTITWLEPVLPAVKP
jgi:hypothetical protein